MCLALSQGGTPSMTLDGRLPVGGPRKPLAEGGIWKPTLQTTVAQERHSAYLALFVSPHSR